MSCISPNIELTWTKVSFWNFLGLNNKGKVLLSLKFTGRNALISLEPRLSLKGRILCEWVIVPYHHWDKRKNIKVSVYSIQSSHLVISKIIILWYERATFLLQFVINLDYIDHNVYLPQSFFAYSPSRAASLVNSALHERCRIVFQNSVSTRVVWSLDKVMLVARSVYLGRVGLLLLWIYEMFLSFLRLFMFLFTITNINQEAEVVQIHHGRMR